VRVRLKTDASAAKGIASRNGLGKARHIEVTQLRLQEKVRSDHCATGEPAERRARRWRLEGERDTPGSLAISYRKGESVFPGSGEGSDTDKQCGDHPLQSGDATTNTGPSRKAIRPRTAVNRSRTRSRVNVRTQELSQRRSFTHPEVYA
jgi:hypothetical protein